MVFSCQNRDSYRLFGLVLFMCIAILCSNINTNAYIKHSGCNDISFKHYNGEYYSQKIYAKKRHGDVDKETLKQINEMFAKDDSTADGNKLQKPVDRPDTKSESIFSSSSYSLSRPGEKLPEGCKTLLDFFDYPRNYDFAKAADIHLGLIDGRKDDATIAPKTPEFDSPYFESAYERAVKDPNDPLSNDSLIKKYGIGGSKENIDLKQVYKELFTTNIELDPTQKEDVVKKINPNYFMYDTMGYIRHYLRNLNVYNYSIHSHHYKNKNSLNYYLNHEYVQEIPKPFPPPMDHTDTVRKYFMDIIPVLMDELVELIKNDPNKHNTPSPPLHSMDLAAGFKLPRYLRDGYEHVKPAGGYTNEDYKMYASLEGLHEPDNHLLYPYSNRQPLYQRKLLAILIDIVNSNDLGPIHTYRKGLSKRAQIFNEVFPEASKDLNIKSNGNSDSNYQPDLTYTNQSYDKLYEIGKKKSSKALVYLEPGNGHLIINGRDGYQYVHYNEARLHEILMPLSCLYIYKKFNVVAIAKGGGISGQSVSIRHALSRYIYRVLSPKLKKILRLNNLVAIDRRKVERKKTNRRKARKQEKYTKR
ncbi:bifunctional Ribosomal protein S5 domain 2-type fold [Babesia duncani]|uniref:Bifunctional Ribosomal protein S5 domain 2-type fold n=1 Tax=Babesia duncani TaxID=323732 RepID=A0AAD9PLF1_9APIC|nr:bifunctional Ribosomal protein S5 domain 2-type fold [Babesia duncani]